MSLAKLLDLKGRTALVTGGSRGLGLQIAEVLGELGAKVAISARKPVELEEAKARLEGLGVETLTVVGDMGRLETIPAMIEGIVEVMGPIDILVNNAGTTWGQPTVEHTLDGWNKVMTLNLTAIFVACQEVGRRCMLPRRSGKVVNIASIQGLSGGYPEGMPTIAYNASKGGVVNMTRMLAKEWAPHGINVNAIAPGYFESKMTQHIFETQHDQTVNLAPLGRSGGPEDLKGATALLATDAGAFVTGQIVTVDGGLTAVF